MDDPHTEREDHQPRRLAPLSRLLGDSVGDVVRILPELAANLRAIRRATESMASEVRGMHTGVRRIEHQVVELRDQLARIDGRVLAVEEHMGRLEPHIAEVNLAMRPLRRARARLPQRSSAPEPDAASQLQKRLPDGV